MSIKILVVGDLVAKGSTIKDILNEYNVLTVHENIEAMHQIDMNPDIDTIILDLAMYSELVKQENLKQKLNQQDLLWDTIFLQAPIGIALSYSAEPFNENSDVLTSINPMFEQITGRTKEELIELGWAKLTHSHDLEEDMRNLNKLKSGQIKSYSMEKRYIKPDGSIVWVHMFVAAINPWKNHEHNHICLVQDITQLKEIEAALLESERSKSTFLSHLPGLAYRCNYDQEWTMQYVSAGCFELTGYSSKSLLHNKELSFNDIIAPEYRGPIRKEWKHILANQLPFKYEYEIITAKGERKWVLEMGQGVYNKQGEVEALEGIILDISDRKEIENNLIYNSEHDRWTGLYNRNYLENILNRDVRGERVGKRALVCINLSDMQSIITTYGLHYTQKLIKKVADSLKLYCTDKRLLFKTYENRFVFYLKEYKDKHELIEFSKIIANTLESLLMIERVGGGIGIFEIDQNNDTDIDQLLKRLLIASEKAVDIYDKDFGICFYDKNMEAQIIREEDIKRELSQIAADGNKGGLFLQYQPILDLQSNMICGFEALARLNSDKFGLVPPLEFIPIAEKTKLIIPIGQEIFRQVFYFLNKLKKIGYDTINISINVSVIQLLENGFIKNLFKMMNEMQIRPENICLEITESVFVSNYEEINNIIGKLKDYGIHIAIDDFGTGYSSLARGGELNVNCLKIDKYFIDKLLLTNPDKAIAGDIISMVHKLGHCAIAEGVEHKEQRQYLFEHGCDKIQGYLISKPLDQEAAIELLQKGW